MKLFQVTWAPSDGNDTTERQGHVIAESIDYAIQHWRNVNRTEPLAVLLIDPEPLNCWRAPVSVGELP